MVFKKVMVYSADERLFRVCRLIWNIGTVGNGKGYSCKLTLAFRAVFPFVRLKLHKSYGGIYGR